MACKRRLLPGLCELQKSLIVTPALLPPVNMAPPPPRMLRELCSRESDMVFRGVHTARTPSLHAVSEGRGARGSKDREGPALGALSGLVCSAP